MSWLCRVVSSTDRYLPTRWPNGGGVGRPFGGAQSKLGLPQGGNLLAEPPTEAVLAEGVDVTPDALRGPRAPAVRHDRRADSLRRRCLEEDAVNPRMYRVQVAASPKSKSWLPEGAGLDRGQAEVFEAG